MSEHAKELERVPFRSLARGAEGFFSVCQRSIPRAKVCIIIEMQDEKKKHFSPKYKSSGFKSGALSSVFQFFFFPIKTSKPGEIRNHTCHNKPFTLRSDCVYSIVVNLALIRSRHNMKQFLTAVHSGESETDPVQFQVIVQFCHEANDTRP